MVRFRASPPARAVLLLLAALAVLPSLRWCRYAWAEVTVECLLGAGAACPASTSDRCDESGRGVSSCASRCDAGATSASRDPSEPVGRATDRGGRAWCPGGPLGGCGLEGRGDPRVAPTVAVLPRAPIPERPAPAPARLMPLPSARPPTRAAPALPPIRAPPASREGPFVPAGLHGPAILA